jgi:hypothetical protein
MSRTHETFAEHLALRTGSERSFGLTVGGILAAFGLYRGLLGSGPDWLACLLLVLGAALVGTGLLAAYLLAPLNRAWTTVGLLLFKVVNPMVMLLIYIVAIVPMGLILKLIGYDPMRRAREPHARSYWIERRPPGPAPETMVDQF